MTSVLTTQKGRCRMNRRASRFAFVGAAIVGLMLVAGFGAQPQGGKPKGAIAGLSRQPSAAARASLLAADDTVILPLDPQTGLFQTVKDVPIADLRANTVALASIAKLSKAPIIYTASEPNGPNGPLMDELDAFKDYATYVPRKGEISAWDNADFVKAVE